MKAALALVFGAMSVLMSDSAQPPKKELPKREQGTLKIGDVAPVFELADVTGKAKVKLADLKGKPVVLIFGSCT